MKNKHKLNAPKMITHAEHLKTIPINSSTSPCEAYRIKDQPGTPQFCGIVVFVIWPLISCHFT